MILQSHFNVIAKMLKSAVPRSPAPRILKGHNQIVSAVTVSSDGARLLSADIDNSIRTWDRYAGEALNQIEVAGSGPRQASLSPNGRFVVASDKDDVIRMWKAKNGEPVREFRGHTDILSGLAWLPKSDRFLSCSFDMSLILWNAETGAKIRQFGRSATAKDSGRNLQENRQKSDGHSTWIRDVAVLPDGNEAISAGNDQVLFIWDIESGGLVDRLIGHSAAVIRLAISPDGRFVVSLGADNEMIVWDANERKLVRRTIRSGEGFPTLAISPDSRTLAFGNDKGLIRFVDLQSGQDRRQIDANGVGITALAFAPAADPEFTEIIAGCSDGTIRLWPALLDKLD